MKKINHNNHIIFNWFKRKLRLGAIFLFSSVQVLLVTISVLMAQEAPKSEVARPTPPLHPEPTAASTPAAASSGAPSSSGSPEAAAKPKKQVLSFENADLRVVIQAMAKTAGISVIIPEDVKGTVTARLVDVPIERAMKTILESKGYSLIELDGVYQIKSKESIAAEPTRTEIFQFANASAKEAKPTVDKLLTKAGNAQLDERSNTLVITDVPSNLAKLIPIIKTLDTPTPQVLIETKLMEMTRNPQEAIGINWASLASYQVSLATTTAASAGTGTANTSSGRLLTGITRSGDAGAIGSANAGRRGGVITPVGFAGYPFAAVLDAPAFTATFSFLLQDSDTELLGSPKVITADNKEAVIKIATQEPIPNFTFNQQTASFVISGFEFKDIGNILHVTPHVNKDNFITMDVTPEVSTAQTGNNGRTFALPGGSITIPLISIRTLTSRVMVKSGNTLALGGLLEATANRGYTKVPFLGDIPGLGELFRSRSFSKTKRNLLIFVTPTIIGTESGTGYEDQYAQLREPNEDDRFAYKKSFMGNAKPRDQFRKGDDGEDTVLNGVNPEPTFNDSSKEIKKEALDRAVADKVQSTDLNPDQLIPRLVPGLREE